MDIIKEDPGSHEETCKTEYYRIHVKPEEQFVPITFPALKTEGTEEPWHGTSIKEEMKDEIISEQHEVYPDGLYGAEDDSFAVRSVKEEIKDEIKIEEHEICLNSIEQPLREQDYGRTSSVTDVGESAVHEWDCTGGIDPLLLFQTDGSSCKFLCAGSEKQESHNVELTNKDTLSLDSGDKPSEFKLSHSLNDIDVEPLKCKVCNNGFRSSSHLLIHSRIHTGEKHKCDVCIRGFRRPCELVLHSRSHTGEKPHKCDVCYKGFNRSRALANHLRTHTGEKPYKCEVCNKSFNHSGSLVTHSLIHTGEKPFTCDVCNKGFRRSSEL